MDKKDKPHQGQFFDFFLPAHPVLPVIEDFIAKLGVNPKSVRKATRACLVYHFVIAEGLSIVARVYRFDDLTYFLHLEAAFSSVDAVADLSEVAKVFMSMNAEIPYPIRVAQSGGFFVAQSRHHLAKHGDADWIPTTEDFWWLDEVLEQLIATAIEAREQIGGLPGHTPLPVPAGRGGAAS